MGKNFLKWTLGICILLAILVRFIIYPWFIKIYGPTEPIYWGVVGTGYFDAADFDLVPSVNERYKRFGVNVTNLQCDASVYITHIDDALLEEQEFWIGAVAPLTKLYKLNKDGKKIKCSIQDFKKGDLVSVKIGEAGIDGNLILYILEMTLIE